MDRFSRLPEELQRHIRTLAAHDLRRRHAATRIQQAVRAGFWTCDTCDRLTLVSRTMACARSYCWFVHGVTCRNCYWAALFRSQLVEVCLTCDALLDAREW